MGYPASITIKHQEKSSRLWALLTILYIKVIALIPHMICVFVLQICTMFVAIIGIFAVLFTGKYPLGMEKFIVKVGNWQLRMSAYYLCITDKYPPFGMDVAGQPTEVKFEHQEKSSRLMALLTLIPIKYILLIPHMVVMFLLEIALLFAVIFGILGALFLGRYPMWCEKVVVTFLNYVWRLQAYFLCLTDKYPPIGWGDPATSSSTVGGGGVTGE